MDEDEFHAASVAAGAGCVMSVRQNRLVSPTPHVLAAAARAEL
jgi:hypothetical protein